MISQVAGWLAIAALASLPVGLVVGRVLRRLSASYPSPEAARRPAEVER